MVKLFTMELAAFQLAFGARLTKAREAKELSFYALWQKTGVGASHIKAYEEGKENACLDSIRKLSIALEVPAKYFFDWE